MRLLHCSFCQIRQKHTIPKQTGAEYCVESVRKSDHEHYLTNLMLPTQLRTHAFAIRAFNCEVSGVRDSVSEKQIGLMRLQFWRDTIDRIYENNPPQHPVAGQLHRAVLEHSLSKSLLLRLVDSREQFISDRPFESLEEVEKYADKAFGSVYLLFLEIINNSDGHLKHAATALGRVEGLLTLLRAVPYNVSKRRVYLPTDLLMERDLSAEEIIRSPVENEPLREVVEIIASRAQEHLNSCRYRSRMINRENKRILLPAVAADAYLHKLSKCDCNVFDSKLNQRNSFLPLSLYYHKIRGFY
ncbi:NADH dehydrogenase (ubiquinone) complex I, assembly factor 6 [Eurytemora carolleeae]|uniref:NADH dehydrogenase (ubiquinone) complex I, assembly factor 6 n=1 Tax=Eurytemora carolleeae TaxID=1294199 RepID=UPI000C78860A|nr:NADH dehydrogenase (ubiquinone) complex I, assembly factor 6 [Eurytemora carolleeae]|eukprot:XP_023333361.1 NADH dehydrogenase (ubiquinone) complex I, assembly factor 6-like [Eurytemora affinis]